MLIVFVSTATLSITIFIVENLRQSETKRIRTRCLYLAQAGINQALYSYRNTDRSGNGTFSVGQTFVGSDNFTLGGTDADFLMVDVSVSSLSSSSGTKNELRNVWLQNVTNAKNIIIQSVTLSWNNANTSFLTSIIQSGTVIWSGSVDHTGVNNLDLNPDVTLSPGSRISLRYHFSGDMSVSTISIQYFLSDGSRRSETIYPQADVKNFTINSTGRAAGSNIYRTIRASYNSYNSTPAIRKVFEYKEINVACNPITWKCCNAAGTCY